MRRAITFAALTLIIAASLSTSAAPTIRYLSNSDPWALAGDVLILANGTSLKALNLSNGGQVMWERSLFFIPDVLMISPNNEYVVACGNEGGAALLFVINGSEVADVRGRCPALFSLDSSWLVLGTDGGLWMYDVEGGAKKYYRVGFPVDVAWIEDELIVVGLSGDNGTAYIIRPLGEAEEVGRASGIAGFLSRHEAVLYSPSNLYFISSGSVRVRISIEGVLMATTLSNGLVATSLVNGSVALVSESGIVWSDKVFPGNMTYPVIDFAAVIHGYVIIETRSSVVPEWAVIMVDPVTGEIPIKEVTNETRLHAYPSDDGYLLITRGSRESELYRIGTGEVKEIAKIEAGGRGLWCGTRLIISEPKPKLVTVYVDEVSVADVPIKGDPIRWFPGCALLLTSEPLSTMNYMLRVYNTSTWEEIGEREVSLREFLIASDAIIKEITGDTYLIVFPSMKMIPIPDHALLLVTIPVQNAEGVSGEIGGEAQASLPWDMVVYVLLVAVTLPLLATYLARRH